MSLVRVTRAPANLIWHIGQAATVPSERYSGSSYKYNDYPGLDKFLNGSGDTKGLAVLWEEDTGWDLPLPMPTIRYGSPVDPKEWVKGHPEMVLFGETFSFGGSNYETRDPGSAHTFRMRAQFSRESFEGRRRAPLLKQSELITMQMYQYAWGVALMLQDDAFVNAVSPKGIKQIDVPDAFPFPPDLLVDLPLVRSVTLNFVVYTN